LKRIACASYKQHLVREREELCWLPGDAVCDNGRNALFLTHFLSFCIPSSQKKKKKKRKRIKMTSFWIALYFWLFLA